MKYAIGDKVKVRIPNSYKYGNRRGKTFEGEVTREYKKSYEVTVWHKDGFSCVYLVKATGKVR